MLGALAQISCRSGARGRRPLTSFGPGAARLLVPLLAVACRSGTPPPEGPVRLVLAAYTAPREVYEQSIIPAFQRRWREKTGQDVVFETSYRGSEAQVCAILTGLEADVAALSHAGDLDALNRLGFITHDWRRQPDGGIVTSSIVVIAVRPGNPRGIRGWEDLARPGLGILTPDPLTSGGGRWNVSALYGSALRGHAGVPRGDPKAAQAFLRDVFRNVVALDSGARQSIVRFTDGLGDVALTYENEFLAARRAGRDLDLVVPSSTLLIENPVAVVDKNADRHGVRKAAAAFVEFLWSDEAQRAFAEHGFRPVDEQFARGLRYEPVEDLWRIGVLGGWQNVEDDLFGSTGRFTQAWNELHPEG